MPMTTRDAMQSIARELRDLYAQVDAAAETQIAQQNLEITCRKGCAHCCYKVTTVTVAEAITIANTLLQQPRWRDTLPTLFHHAQEQGAGTQTEAEYFAKQIPCPFLNPKKLCTIHPVRPSCCRYQMVISDPMLCSPERPGAQIATLDPTPAQAYVARFDEQLRAQLGPSGEPFAAPLSLMLIHCLHWLFPDDAEIGRMATALPEPQEWSRRFHTTLPRVTANGGLPILRR